MLEFEVWNGVQEGEGVRQSRGFVPCCLVSGGTIYRIAGRAPVEKLEYCGKITS